MHDYLQAILENKRREVAQLKDNAPQAMLNILQGKNNRKPTHSFKEALSNDGIAIIAEIKRKSPSKNHLAEIIDPVSLAKQYAQGGAAAISVLTDNFGFNGALSDLEQVVGEVSVPVLRKDFILDAIQIAEAIHAGADAVLLIVAVLQDKTAELLKAARDMGMDVLVEVHDEAELDYALTIDADIIGINNRNLKTFEVDINNALTLRRKIPEGVVSVAESGIHTVETAAKCIDAGFNALLIGEALVKSPNPQQFIQEALARCTSKQ